ncbi:hypothetical protein ACOMHN_006591 [Nucella lapillus]
MPLQRGTNNNNDRATDATDLWNSLHSGVQTTTTTGPQISGTLFTAGYKQQRRPGHRSLELSSQRGTNNNDDRATDLWNSLHSGVQTTTTTGPQISGTLFTAGYKQQQQRQGHRCHRSLELSSIQCQTQCYNCLFQK